MKGPLEKVRNKLSPTVRVGWERSSIGSSTLSMSVIGFDEQQKYLELMLNQVVIGDHETGVKRSNSLIVFGPPGSGKTTFVESILAKMSEDRNGDFYNYRRVVRLNGKLCSDFRSSVEEICWQLKFSDFNEEGSENTFEDVRSTANFDDRLEQTMAFLKTSMKSLNASIIFILDKLELFAEQPNQGLLYNLFDLAANSSSTIPICIIGITDRVDVLELFEKRVKSRFSHRQINLVGGYDFEKYVGIVERLLNVKSEDKWNETISELLKTKEVLRILQAIFDTDKSIRQLTVFLYSVCLIAEKSLKASHFNQVFQQNFRQEANIKVALDLPISDLLVLLAIYKQMQNNNQQAWQPKSLYKIVEKIVAPFGLEKEDFLKAVSKLEALELIIPVSGSQRNTGGVNNISEIYFKSEITVPEMQTIWKTYPHLPSSFQELL